MFEITAASIAKHYESLNRIGVSKQDAGRGFHRPAYSLVETEAFAYIEETARLAGLGTRWDSAGNLVVETPGIFDSWFETGSHLDTVAGGGNYDGVAGVVAGLEVLLSSRNVKLSHGLRLRVWRGEESAAFGTASLGSWAAFGQLDGKVLHSSYEGQTLGQAMLAQGVDPEPIRQGKSAISRAEMDGIIAHVELHIEQGNILESQSKDIGIVTGIRGSIRSWVRLQGVFDHSGATPMGTEYRKDANLAMAHMIVALDRLLAEFNDGSQDVVQTFGAINSHGNHNQRFPLIFDNAVSKVSGFAYFSFEVRSCSAAQAEAYHARAQALLQEIARSFMVTLDIELISTSRGVPLLDAAIQQRIKAACESRRCSFTHLASGAWHDVAVVSQQKRSDGSAIPTGLIFIPCRAGISHSAAEYTSAEQIALGATVLAEVMVNANQ